MHDFGRSAGTERCVPDGPAVKPALCGRNFAGARGLVGWVKGADLSFPQTDIGCFKKTMQSSRLQWRAMILLGLDALLGIGQMNCARA